MFAVRFSISIAYFLLFHKIPVLCHTALRMSSQQIQHQAGAKRSLQGHSLVDLLDRILDKGIVIAGDIIIQLADVELLTIKIRLIIWL